MNEARIHDLLAQAYNRLAAELRSGHPDFDGAMEDLARLFDPKGTFNTPTMVAGLHPELDRAVRDIREIMERFRDANRESIEDAARDVWRVVSRREVVTELRVEAEESR
jgi:hypothetical protein